MKSNRPASEAATADALGALLSDTAPVSTKECSDDALKRTLSRVLFLSVYAIVTLYVFVLAPLYVRFANDILYMTTGLPDLLSLLLALLDIAVFAIAYAVILYGVYRLPMRRVRGLLLIYGGAILYRNVVNLVMTYLTDGIPVKDEIGFDLISVLSYIVLEALQCALVVFIAHKVISNMRKQEEIRLAAAVKLKKQQYTPLLESFPFDRLFSFRRPVQKAAFLIALVPMGVKVLSRIVYDLGIGLPTSLSEVLVMLLYYGADIVGYGLVLYALMLLMLSAFNKKDSAFAAPETEEEKISL